MSYFGGNTKGYEAGVLSIGIACTDQDPASVHEWIYLNRPVLAPTDKEVRWWENSTQYKSTIIRDIEKLTGHMFVMFYNARGDSINPGRGAERIGMAVSDDMITWERYMKDPVINHHKGISGDAYIQKIGDIYVMFYFGAFWNKQRSNAFNRFACSYDLVHWTDWSGEDLIAPTEPYDDLFAHKSYVVKWNGVVYHFYCAVNKKQQRGIAVATSKDMGKSGIGFENLY
jgi:sucrose-6-phosphate hydrolase SacC (GH32 family)